MSWLKANITRILVIMVMLALGITLLNVIDESFNKSQAIKGLKEDAAILKEELAHSNLIIGRQIEQIDSLIGQTTTVLDDVKGNIKSRKKDEKKAMDEIANTGIQLVDSTRDRLNRIIFTEQPFDTR